MLSRCAVLITFALALTSAVAMAVCTSAPDARLAVRESLFPALQKNWFDAIVCLDNELMQPELAIDPGPGSESGHDNQVVARRIGFELGYRMQRRSGRDATDSIGGIVDEASRNEAFYRLAQVYFRKDQPAIALRTLERIRGKISPEISNEVAFFRSEVLMANGRVDDAIAVLQELKKSRIYPGYTDFNLGMALFRDGNEDEGFRQLDHAGQISSKDESVLAVRDKANLVLGEKLLDAGSFEKAGAVLDRVRLEGLFSTDALLASGWVSASQQNYRQALVPWTVLSERAVTDAAVQEAMLAVPFSYGKLGIYRKAAILYGRAVETYGAEIDKLTASIESIRDGRFLSALAREEHGQDAGWIVKLRELPDMPETYYLLDLLASHAFRESLQNYLDLVRLREKLLSWQRDIAAYEDIIEKRRAFYEPLLPAIDAEFRELDARIRERKEQRDLIGRRLDALKKTSRPDLLTTANEKNVLEEIDRVDRLLQPHHTVKTRSRIERLRGLVYWPIYSRYDQRLMATHANFERLNDVIAILMKQYDRYVLIRRAATRSYSGYDDRLVTLRHRIDSVLEHVESVIPRQGLLLEAMAEGELVRRAEVLQEMQVKARFAMADCFDRAARPRSAEGDAR